MGMKEIVRHSNNIICIMQLFGQPIAKRCVRCKWIYDLQNVWIFVAIHNVFLPTSLWWESNGFLNNCFDTYTNKGDSLK